MPSEIKNIRPVSSRIIHFVEKRKKDISRDTLFDIKLCLEEAIRNAVIHGNKLKKEYTVDISYDIEGNSLKVTVEDKGNGFKVEDLPDPTHKDNLYAEGGRGVYIIHRLMDNLTYNEKGNRVTMEKKLT